MHTLSKMIAFSFLYNSWFMLLHVQSVFADVSLCRSLHTSTEAVKNLPKKLIVPKKDWSYFLLEGNGVSV